MPATLTPGRKAAVYSDPIEAAQATCQTCGMLMDDPGEFHPYAFCVWKKAGLDPWEALNWTLKQFGRDPIPYTLVRNIRPSRS